MTMGQKTVDAELQEAVTRELRWDARVDASSIGVTVEEGVVTLSGTVTSWGKRTAAEQAAHRVHGVLDVANDLKVHVPGGIARTDTEIAKAVRHALAWSVFVPAESILSTVSDGWVTLDGTLDAWTQKEDAEAVVRDLACVVGVTNRIAVVPPRLVLEGAIEEALERRATREAKRVELTLKDGHVVVSGSVQSWPEKQAVLGAVKGTAGVASVEDRLRIVPFVM